MSLKRLIIVMAVIAAALAPLSKVGADSPKPASNISIRPFLQELKLNPGQASVTYDLTINNDSSQSQTFNLSSVNFGTLNETGGLVFEGQNSIRINNYGLAKWISLSQNSFTLERGQQATIQVTANNDIDMAPGAHYAAIITSATSANTTGQLKITPKVSSLLFLTKLGGEKYDIHLEEIAHNGNLWTAPDLVTLSIRSTGNTYIIPRGIASLKLGGKTISRGIINPQSSIVLPQTARSFAVPLAKLSSSSSNWIFNNYKLQVDYRYDGIDRFASKTVNIRTLNKRGISIIIILILLALAVKRLIIDNQKLKTANNKRRRKA